MVQKATIEFTKGEADDLFVLIDIAVKTQGLRVSSVGTALAQKINAAFAPKAPEKKEEVKK